MSGSRIKTIGITMGGPSGVGPEVIAKALSKPVIRNLARFKIIGDYNIFLRYCDRPLKNCAFIDLKILNSKQVVIGKSNDSSAMASLKYLEKAVTFLKTKEICALVTAPVCKEAVCLLGKKFQGHTEFLANAFKVKKYAMMFVGGPYRTVVVTRHIPLNKVSHNISKESVCDTIMLTNAALKKYFKIKRPNIAVCGLNPHAGEGGRIGGEEQKVIIPAMERAKRQGVRIVGPFPSDTVFVPGILKQYDVIIAMYHDQGLIPIKTLAFTRLVNLTVGLPFVRTSPAHGTAFNIAGQYKADPTSMCEAIKLAALLTK